MDFGLSHEQTLLADSVTRFLQDHAPRIVREGHVIELDLAGARAERLGAYLGEADPAANATRIRTLIRRFGLDVADRFTTVWEDVSGERYHPWAEAAMAVDVLRWPATSATPARARWDLEASITRALAELGA